MLTLRTEVVSVYAAHAMSVGTKLVIFDHCCVGQPDEFLVAEDEAGNMWSIRPELLCGPDDLDLLI